jgi:hypothetical protein
MPKKKQIDAGDEIAFDIDKVSAGSSGEAFSARPATIETVYAEASGVEEEMSSVFRLLARPMLPELKHETRARLMMQSPTRLFFYWSVGSGSFQALQRTVGGGAGDYHLVLRLIDLTNDVEELHPVEPDGSWWFDATPDTEYRAEIGFFSASRPFIRILFSNSVATPRKGPSPHSASESRWAVTTHDFAKVLDASGFEEDAFEVVRDEADSGLISRFARHIGVEGSDITVDPLELGRALGMLASGAPIDDLKFKVASDTYALLTANLVRLTPASLKNEIGVTEETEFETFSAIGGSLVNIPRRRYRPISSADLG